MYKIIADPGVGQWEQQLSKALEPVLGAGGVESLVSGASKYAAQEILPTAMDQLVPAAIDYFDKNRAKVLNKAKPALERLGQDPQARAMVARIAKKGLQQYGDEKFYPKYGKFAAPALAVGSALLVGSLGAGYLALSKTKEEGAEAAVPLVVLTWAANLGGIALTLTGVAFTVGNKVFQHGEKID
jgi:hypothetical protein